ncbi:hypothetical protein CYY_003568 [Polysphondylium violaceum]|uniref:Uncharacterized protein n=1 Tax=Polysphondylium violaceum TaxID=133409 RepID=A0A8J4V111_9MYCE|nr:hypothetical protein CYY_003568 [Polysphondylium violaceum]
MMINDTTSVSNNNSNNIHSKHRSISSPAKPISFKTHHTTTNSNNTNKNIVIGGERILNSGSDKINIYIKNQKPQEQQEEKGKEEAKDSKPHISNLNNNNNSGTTSNSNNSTSNNNINSSPTLNGRADYTITTSISSSSLDFSKDELGIMLKSLKYIDKNRYSSNIKCTILGSSGVGKTSFVKKFSTGQCLVDETSTFGANRSLHTIHYETLTLNIELWDIGGHDRLNGLLPFYVSGSNCIIVMFDVNNRDSFRKAFDLLSKTKSHVAVGSLFLIVANKVDSNSNSNSSSNSNIPKREVSQEQLAKACSESEIGNVFWCEISSSTGYNIHRPFQAISQNITTMINALKSNQRIEKIQNSLNYSSAGNSNTSSGNNSLNSSTNGLSNTAVTTTTILASDNRPSLPSFCEFDDYQEEGDTVGLPNVMTSPEFNLLKNFNYTCIERSFKPTPATIVVKLEPLKIIIEPSNNGLFNKLLSRRTLFFKEDNNLVNLNSSGNNSNSNSNNSLDENETSGSGNSGGNNSSSNSNGSFCIVVDKYHPKRIEFKRKTSTLSSSLSSTTAGVSSNSTSGSTTSEFILLLDYREHLIKSFKTMCNVNIPIIEGINSGSRADFLLCFREYCKHFGRESLVVDNKKFESRFGYDSSGNVNGLFTKLDLSCLLKEEQKLLVNATIQSLLWNGTIETLDLSSNNLGQLDLALFSELLQAINNSISILNLNLSTNNLSIKHKSILIEFIQSMKLKSLILNDNQLSSFSNLIFQSLSQNDTLLHLGLSKNALVDDNAQSISQMLKSNNTIESIDLSNNIIKDQGGLYLLSSIDSKLSSSKVNNINNNIGNSGSGGGSSSSHIAFKKLDLSNNIEISNITLKQIKTMLNKC